VAISPTVLLFDIDGTLLSSGGAGRRAMERAFAQRYDRADACRGFSFAGMTDRAIVRTALRTAQIAVSEAEIDAAIEIYLRCLEEELPTASDYRVHAGVIEALQAIARDAAFAVGLGTGNVERGAAMKLAHGGLAGRFSFGGYGSDHEERPELIRVGAERGAQRLRRRLADCRVVVIGDTPLDVAAALTIGAECVGVATGRHDVSTLRAAGATAAFADLASDGALEAILGG
jgi:phosphoglycolate phosphatase